jgi:hypothetical protein
VIPAVHARGTNVGGLLRYLFGPGRREEHTDPHIVAAWSDAGDLSATSIKALTRLLEQPVATGRNRPAKTVWHCSIRTHPSDRRLSDAEWGHIASEVMAAVGLAPYGDHKAVRWLAVRHAEDHIHLVATLVRQDRRTAWAWKDKLHSQQACRDLEKRYGLRRVAASGASKRRWPTRGALRRAERTSMQAVSSSLPMLRAYVQHLEEKGDHETAIAVAAVMKMARRQPGRSR